MLTLGSSYEYVENLNDQFSRTRQQAGAGIRNIDLAVPEKEATVRLSGILFLLHIKSVCIFNLRIFRFSMKGPLEDKPVVEVHLEHPLLQSNCQVVVPPTGNLQNLTEVIGELFETTTPILLYGIVGDSVSDEVRNKFFFLSFFLYLPALDCYYNRIKFSLFQDGEQLQMIKKLSDKLPVFFIRMPTTEETSGLTEVDRNEVLNHGGFHFTPEGSSSSQFKMESSVTSKSGNNIVDQLEALG